MNSKLKVEIEAISKQGMPSLPELQQLIHDVRTEVRFDLCADFSCTIDEMIK